MSAVGEEIKGSRGGSNTSLARKYTVLVTDSLAPEEEVLDWAQTNAPSSIFGLYLNGISIEESEEIDDQYTATAQYGQLTKSTPPATDSMEYSFNFQAQGGHFYHSLSTIGSFCKTGSGAPLPFGAPDYKGAINVVNDGGKMRVEGFDVQPPGETFKLAYYPVNSTISGAYQLLVESLCGKVASLGFRGRDAGSIMLVRAAGGARNNQSWNIEFGFGYVANQTSIPVGDFTVTAKDGLDLLWPLYGVQKDDTAKQLVTNPIAAYVDRIWYRDDLNRLGLPS